MTKPQTPQEIEARLREALAPEVLELTDVSHTHTADEHTETLAVRERLYQLVVVSEKFDSLLPVARHRIVYEAMGMPGNPAIHGVSIHAFSPNEWQAKIARL